MLRLTSTKNMIEYFDLSHLENYYVGDVREIRTIIKRAEKKGYVNMFCGNPKFNPKRRYCITFEENEYGYKYYRISSTDFLWEMIEDGYLYQR